MFSVSVYVSPLCNVNKVVFLSSSSSCSSLFLGKGLHNTVIAEIFVRVKISYSGVREFSYAINFRTLMPVSHTLVYV